MSGHRFGVGARVEWGGATYEITRLLIQPASGPMVVLEDVLSGETRTQPVSDLERAYAARQLRFHVPRRMAHTGYPAADSEIVTDTSVARYMALDDIPPHLLEVARWRERVILPLLDIEPRVRTREMVRAHVDEIRAGLAPEAQKTLLGKASVSSVYKWLKWYVEADSDIRALVPSTDRCGRPGKSRLDEQRQRVVENAIKDIYMRPERVTINHVLHEVAVRITQINATLPPTERLAIPSRATVARRIEQLDMLDKVRVKHGSAAARRLARQYRRQERPSMPGEILQVDGTPVDLMLIDPVTDLPSRCTQIIASIDPCFGYPQHISASTDGETYRAFADHCFRAFLPPPADYRERYGTEHTPLLCGLPRVLITDNGKAFRNKSVRAFCAETGIELRVAPPLCPEYKAYVERSMGSMHTMTLHGLPGTTFSTPARRGKYDSEGQAAVYLDDFARVLAIHTYDVWAESRNRAVGGVPARRMEEAIRQGWMPRLPESVERLEAILGAIEYRVVHHYGVELFNLIYQDSELLGLRLALKGRTTKIKYLPGDLSRIFVWHPFERRYIQVLATAQEYAQGLSVWQHQIILGAARMAEDKVDLVALGRARRKIQDIVRAGRDRRNAADRRRTTRWEHSGRSVDAIAERAPSPALTRELPPPNILAPTPIPIPIPILPAPAPERERAAPTLDYSAALPNGGRAAAPRAPGLEGEEASAGVGVGEEDERRPGPASAALPRWLVTDDGDAADWSLDVGALSRDGKADPAALRRDHDRSA